MIYSLFIPDCPSVWPGIPYNSEPPITYPLTPHGVLTGPTQHQKKNVCEPSRSLSRKSKNLTKSFLFKALKKNQ